jgi:hypothetical protein
VEFLLHSQRHVVFQPGNVCETLDSGSGQLEQNTLEGNSETDPTIAGSKRLKSVFAIAIVSP